MPTKSNGPIQTDYQRLIRACKREGKDLIFRFGEGVIVVIPKDSSYVEKLALGQHPAPDAKAPEEGHNWNKW